MKTASHKTTRHSGFLALLLVALSCGSCVGTEKATRWLDVDQWEATLRLEIESTGSLDQEVVADTRVTQQSAEKRLADGSGNLRPWSDVQSETFRSWQGEIDDTTVEIAVSEETAWSHALGNWDRSRQGEAATMVTADAKLWIDARLGTYSISFETPAIALETTQDCKVSEGALETLQSLCHAPGPRASMLGCECLDASHPPSEESESRLPAAYFEKEPLPGSGLALSGSKELAPGVVFTWELSPAT